jgi:DNA invertase Pin-like site-specific DNA recombinase
MKIAAYIRVSTSDQTGAGQRREITRWLKAHGHAPKSVAWFEDKETGQHLDRSGLQALNAAIFNGEVDTVIIWKLDRLARSLRDGINTLCDWVDGGLRVVSVTQQMDLSGTTGKIVASVLLGLSEIELSNIRERQRAGIDAAKLRGAYKGRKKGTLKANPARAQRLKAQGLRSSEIMKALGIRSRSTLAKYLRVANE